MYDLESVKQLILSRELEEYSGSPDIHMSVVDMRIGNEAFIATIEIKSPDYTYNIDKVYPFSECYGCVVNENTSIADYLDVFNAVMNELDSLEDEGFTGVTRYNIDKHRGTIIELRRQVGNTENSQVELRSKLILRLTSAIHEAKSYIEWLDSYYYQI